jgi:hypothetical protein
MCGTILAARSWLQINTSMIDQSCAEGVAGRSPWPAPPSPLRSREKPAGRFMIRNRTRVG